MPGVLDPELGRLGAHAGGERGDLDAQVHARDRAVRVALEHRSRGQCRGLCECAQSLVAAPRVAVGLGGRDGRLAEQVDRGRGAAPTALERRPASAGPAPTMKRLAIRCTASPATRPATGRRAHAPGRARAAAPPRRGERRGGRPLRGAPSRQGPRPQDGTARPSAPGRATAAPCRGPRARGCGRGRRRLAGGDPPPERAHARLAVGAAGAGTGAGGRASASRPRRYGLSRSVTIVTRPEFLRRLFNSHYARDRVPWRSTARDRRAARPGPGEGELLIAPTAVGICGTDIEIFEGSLAYFRMGLAEFPIVPGHEWTGHRRRRGRGRHRLLRRAIASSARSRSAAACACAAARAAAICARSGPRPASSTWTAGWPRGWSSRRRSRTA